MKEAPWGGSSRYQLISELGRGGMGVVYKATDKELQRVVAVKQLIGEFQVEDLERLEREARAVAQLQHPNIVQVFDMGLRSAQPYIVLELVEGETLDQLLKRGELDLEERVEILIKIAKGVEHAHGQGILHRDIKPSNILVSKKDNEPKLLDFGLARFDNSKHELSRETLTQEGAVLGTVRYMSPEQANGERVNEKADIWALGAILYEALTETPVFAQETSFYNSIVRIVQDSIEPPRKRNPHCPKDLSDLCMKALQKDEARRLDSVEDFRLGLEQWLEDSEESGGTLSHAVLIALVFLAFSLALFLAAQFTGTVSTPERSSSPKEKRGPQVETKAAKDLTKEQPRNATKQEPKAVFQGRISADFPWVEPQFSDLNGDGCDDIITVVKNGNVGDRGYVTVFDGHSGKQLWQFAKQVSSWGKPCVYREGNKIRVATVGVENKKVTISLIDGKSGKQLAMAAFSERPRHGRKEPKWPLSLVTWEMGPNKERLFVCCRQGDRASTSKSTIYFWNQSRAQTLKMTTDEFETKGRKCQDIGREILPWWSKEKQRVIGFFWVCNSSLIGVQFDDIQSKSSLQVTWSHPPLTATQLNGMEPLYRAYFAVDPSDPGRFLVSWYKHHRARTVLQLVENSGKIVWTKAFSEAQPNADNPRWLNLGKNGGLVIGFFRRTKREKGPSDLKLLNSGTGEEIKSFPFDGWLSSMGAWTGQGPPFLAVSCWPEGVRLRRLDRDWERLVAENRENEAYARVAVADLNHDGRPELIIYRPHKRRLNNIEIMTPRLR